MPGTPTLFIVISDQLRYGKDSPSKIDVTDKSITLGTSTLVMLSEPDSSKENLWDKYLKNHVIQCIQAYQPDGEFIVRIAGHYNQCFGRGKVFRAEKRFPTKEEELIAELKEKVDLQIWGFHRVEESIIWMRLSELGEITKGTPTEEFANQLFTAFSTANSSTRVDRLSEQLSVLKHEMIALFTPLKLKLETAQRKKTTNPERAEQLLSEVRTAIGGLLTRAVTMLQEAKPALPEYGLTSCKKVEAHLASVPILEFGRWLRELDEHLNDLRDEAAK